MYFLDIRVEKNVILATEVKSFVSPGSSFLCHRSFVILYFLQKFIHALSPTPASKMSASELCTKPPNTTMSPYSLEKEIGSGNGATKRSGESLLDSQYWRYDVSKRQKHGDGVGDRLCFKFVSSGSCQRGDKCHFRHDEDAREQSLRGVCFEFLNKGKCERGPDCTYKHELQEEGKALSGKRSGSGTGSSNRSKDKSLFWVPFYVCCSVRSKIHLTA